MKKFLLTILSIVCALSLTLGIVGCGNNGDGDNPPATHTHTYSANYSSDDNYHWLSATCEHTDLVDKKGEHTYDEGVLNEEGTLIVYTCTVCGKTKTENVIPPYFGFGGKLDLNHTDKYWDNLTKNYVIDFLAGLSEDGINVDVLGSGSDGEGDFTLFVRDGILYVGNGIEDMEIANLAELKGQLDKFDYRIIDLKALLDEAISKTNTALNVDVEVLLGAVISALEDQAFVNLYQSCMVGAYNYLSIESKVVEGNTKTVYDLHKTVDNLLDTLKEVGTYLDLNVNVETATIKSLYNSQAVKELLEPLFKEMNASDIQAVLTHAEEIIENISVDTEHGPQKLNFPFEIIDAGDMSAYEYIGKYLDAEITYGTQTIVLGNIKLKDAFGEFYAQEDGTVKLVDLIEEAKGYLDSILPILKFSYTTEGVSAEMGKLVGVDFEIKVISIDDYHGQNDSTYINYAFDFVYGEDDAFNGFTFDGYVEETDEYFDEKYFTDLTMSLLPTANGFELKFNTENSNDYSDTVYVMDFVANLNVYADNDGDFKEVEIIATAKEQNKTIFNFDISAGVEYDVIADVKQIVEVGSELNLKTYYSDGALRDTLFAEYYTDLIYENDLLKEIDMGIAYEYVLEDYVGEYVVTNGSEESFEFDYEIFFDYNEKGLLTSVENAYYYKCENLDIYLEPYLFAGNIEFTYNDSDLLTKAELYIEEQKLITLDVAYAENSDMVTSVKASFAEDMLVAEVKFEYTEELEVSKVEFIVDFVLAGMEGEDGEPVVEPYEGQLKISVVPVFNGEELIGVKGDIYLDTRDDKYEGTYEFNVFGEEPEFIDLTQITGYKLTLEELMDIFGLDGVFGGVTEGPAPNPYA